MTPEQKPDYSATNVMEHSESAFNPEAKEAIRQINEIIYTIKERHAQELKPLYEQLSRFYTLNALPCMIIAPDELMNRNSK